MKGNPLNENRSENPYRAGHTGDLSAGLALYRAVLPYRIPLADRRCRPRSTGRDRPVYRVGQKRSDPPGLRPGGQSHRPADACGEAAGRLAAGQHGVEGAVP